MEGKAKVTIDDFTQLALLGKGSYGEVFLVEKKSDKQVYALKTMDKENKQHHVFIEREVLSSFKSEWIIELSACFQDKSRLFFLLENARNGELADFLKLHKKLDLEQTKFVSAEIVLILEFLREGGIVHRDLKPENILFDEGNHLKLIDFATSKFFKTEKNGEFFKRVEAIKAKYLESLKDKAQEDGPTEHRNSFVGTPIYLSPELIRGEEVSYAADMWALGIMIYQMLTGDVPFKNESEYDLYEAIKFEAVKFPEGLDPSSKSIIEGLLDKDQSKRLGCGEAGSGNSLQDLKKHPFFENVQWEGLRNTPSPIKKALNPLKTEEKETDYYKEQSRKPKVLKSGLVRKLKSFFLYNTRQFILFDNASIDYLDPENGELKGTIKLTKDCKVKAKKDPTEFDLEIPGRTYNFKSMEYPASEWIDTLTKEIQRLEGKGLSFENV